MGLESDPKLRASPWERAVAPPVDRWDDWVELDPAAWSERRERHYQLVPTICFNCESACVLLAYVDREKGTIRHWMGGAQGAAHRIGANTPAAFWAIFLAQPRRDHARGSIEREASM